MQRTEIEWTDYTWNPIKGLCPVDCKLPDGRSYCYARRMYKRFGWNPKVELDGELFGSRQDAFAPNINVYEKLGHIKAGSKIFICSTFELFHPCIHKEWRDAIFRAIKEHPQHTFQILTKFPQNIDRPMPDNVWLGVSVDEPIKQIRISELKKKKARIKFVSFEPMLGRMNDIFFPKDELYLEFKLEDLDWIIIGRLTGHGNKYDPQKIWIQEIVNKAKELNIPIFLKNNLKSIVGENLIQEMPE